MLHKFPGQLAMAVALWDYVAGAFTAGVPAGYLKSQQPAMTQEQAEHVEGPVVVAARRRPPFDRRVECDDGRSCR